MTTSAAAALVVAYREHRETIQRYEESAAKLQAELSTYRETIARMKAENAEYEHLIHIAGRDMT